LKWKETIAFFNVIQCIFQLCVLEVAQFVHNEIFDNFKDTLDILNATKLHV